MFEWFECPEGVPQVASGGCDGWSGRLLDRGFHDVSYPDQVVSRGSEGEHPTDAFAAAMLGLAQTGGGFDPAKDLFNELAFVLALAITIVTRGASVDAAGTARNVLRHMRRDGVLP